MVLEFIFSNPLVIHQVKTKEITTVKVWIPVLISIDFDDVTSPFTLQFLFRLRRYIKHARHGVSSVFQAPRISSKILRCVSYFQLCSWCLDILMKHCLSYLIYYIYNWMYHASLYAGLKEGMDHCQRPFLELFIVFTFESQPALCESVALGALLPCHSLPRPLYFVVL